MGDGVGFTFGWYADGTAGEHWTLEPGATATWAPGGLASGLCTVTVHYRLMGGDGLRRTLDDKAQYTINTTTGPVTVTVDQNQKGVSTDEVSFTLGEFQLDSTAWLKLTRGDTSPGNWTIAADVTFSTGGQSVTVSNPAFNSYFLGKGLTTLAPNSYVVLVSNYAAFDARYDITGNNIPVVGVYTGNLDNNGEKLAVYQLGDPDPNIIPAYRTDYVNYGDSGDWPGRADGEGSSLFRVHPAAYGNEPANWQTSAMGNRPGQPATRLDKSPPSMPTNLAAVSTVLPSNSVTLTWSASSDAQSYVDHYLVYRDASLPVTVSGTSYVDTAVVATTPYSYRVSAVNRDGYESALCDAVSVSIPGIVSCTTPEGRIEIVFSEPLRADTATVPANYSINGSQPTGVTLTTGNTKVVLTTSAFDSTSLVATGAAGKVLIPTSDLGTAWTATNYNDASWTPATTGVGYEVALPAEVEPNDATTTASLAARNFAAYTGNLYQMGLTGTADGTGTGDDWFKIGALDVGDKLTITGSGSPSSRGTSTNVYIELWRAGDTGNYVAADDDSGPGLDALIGQRVITVADTYYVKIRRSSTSVAAGTYALDLWLENTGNAPSTDATLAAETEANDLMSTANNAGVSWRPVQYLSRTSGQITSAGDVDYFKYTLAAGDLVSVQVVSGGALDAKVTLQDGSGTPIGLEDGTSGSSDLNSAIYTYIVPAAGTYYVKVQSSGSTTGNYNADVYLSSFAPPPIFTPSIGTNLQTSMYNVNATAYLRIPFTVSDLSALSGLRLRMKYDDGFVAYLNGTEIVRRNAPTTVLYNSAATADRLDLLSTMYEEIDVTAFLSALRQGVNVLAVQGLNRSLSDTDMLLVPELLATRVGTTATVTITNLATQSGNQITNPVQVSFPYVPQGTGNVLREYWTSVAGVNVSDLTGSTSYPGTPTAKSYPTMLEAPYNWADNYGTRMRGYVYPPMTGDYTFWIAGDDTCELWLSTDDNPANKQKIAYIASAGTNTYRNWTNFTSIQQSVAISLAAGQRYYIEVVQKDSSGTDNCSVRWRLPDGTWENGDLNAPIPGVRLSPYGTVPDLTPPSVPQHLTAQPTAGNTQITLSWDAAYDPDYKLSGYVIYRDGTRYATSATASYVDTDVSPGARHRYQVTASNLDGVESAMSAALVVAPLGIGSVGAFTLNTVQVTFSEAVEPSSAEVLANYSIPGVSIASAQLEADRMTLTLATSTLAVNTNYTINIGSVLTSSGATISASTKTFRVGGGVLREYWLNIGNGTTVANLTGNASYPSAPTGREYLTQSFESPINWTTNYGERDRAYLVPDVSGYYTFWIAGDDASQLLLSTTANRTTDPSCAVQIAQVTSATGSREWNKSGQAQQKSASIYLTAGQEYYIEALMKQGAGTSNLAVGWQRPDAPTYPNQGVTSISRSGNLATATISNHGYSSGQTVLISGAAQSEYNGQFQITVLDANRFTYTVTGTPASPATGTIAANTRYITRSGTTATVRIPSHGLVNGDYVALSVSGQTDYTGAFRVSGVTADTFTITVASANGVSPCTGLTASKLLPIPASYLVPYTPTYPNLNVNASPNSITRSGPLATANVDNHGFVTGQTVLIRGATQPEYNGTFTITVLNANQFTYTVSGTPVSPATGTITANTRFITRSGATATVTIPSHGFTNGTYVSISGLTQPEYNGVFAISGATTNTFNITVSGSPASPATGTLSVNKLLPMAAGSSVAYSLLNLTGAAYSGTIDSQGTTDSTPAFQGTVSDPAASITVGVGGVYYAATNYGNSTWTLSAGSVRTALADGIYPVSVCFSDTMNRSGFDSTTNDLVVDHVLPTAAITGFGSGMRNTSLGQLQIVFSEPVSGFGLADLRFCRSGGSDLLTGVETLTTADNITWTLSGLPAQATRDVPYTLTLLGVGSKIADRGGQRACGRRVGQLDGPHHAAERGDLAGHPQRAQHVRVADPDLVRRMGRQPGPGRSATHARRRFEPAHGRPNPDHLGPPHLDPRQLVGGHHAVGRVRVDSRHRRFGNPGRGWQPAAHGRQRHVVDRLGGALGHDRRGDSQPASHNGLRAANHFQRGGPGLRAREALAHSRRRREPADRQPDADHHRRRHHLDPGESHRVDSGRGGVPPRRFVQRSDRRGRQRAPGRRGLDVDRRHHGAHGEHRRRHAQPARHGRQLGDDRLQRSRPGHDHRQRDLDAQRRREPARRQPDAHDQRRRHHLDPGQPLDAHYAPGHVPLDALGGRDHRPDRERDGGRRLDQLADGPVGSRRRRQRPRRRSDRRDPDPALPVRPGGAVELRRRVGQRRDSHHAGGDQELSRRRPHAGPGRGRQRASRRPDRRDPDPALPVRPDRSLELRRRVGERRHSDHSRLDPHIPRLLQPSAAEPARGRDFVVAADRRGDGRRRAAIGPACERRHGHVVRRVVACGGHGSGPMARRHPERGDPRLHLDRLVQHRHRGLAVRRDRRRLVPEVGRADIRIDNRREPDYWWSAD